MITDVKNKTKCLICGGKATGRYMIDLDVAGFGYCKDHKDRVKELITWVILDPKIFEKMLSISRKQYKNKK